MEPSAPPPSPSPFTVWPQTIENRACAGNFAPLVAAENAPNRRFRQFALKFLCGDQIRGHDENRNWTEPS